VGGAARTSAGVAQRGQEQEARRAEARGLTGAARGPPTPANNHGGRGCHELTSRGRGRARVQAGPQVDAAPADRRRCVRRRPRIRAGYAWQPPCPVPLVGEGPEGAAPPPRPAFARGATPVALGRRRA